MSNDEDQADTQLAPTAQAYGALDDEPELVEPHSWHDAFSRSAVILGCCAVLAVTIGAALWHSGSNDTPPTQGAPQTAQMPAESASAPPVHAVLVPDVVVEDQDSRFVAEVTAQGITGPRSAILENAHNACTNVKAGVSWADIVNGIVRDCPTVTPLEARMFAQTAITTYCP